MATPIPATATADLPRITRNGVHFGTYFAFLSIRPSTDSSWNLCAFDVGRHLLLQHVERQAAVSEYDVVKRANVEPGAERLFGLALEVPDLQLADLVGERLTGVGDVAIHLGQRLAGRVLLKVGAGLIPRPALGVDAGVYHQPHGAKALAGQLAEPRRRIAVDGSQHAPQGLRVESPA